MVKGGVKTKKSVEKKVPKKVNLIVKVETSPRKTRAKIASTEIKSAHVFDKPEDIKKKKQAERKKLITWKKKKTDNGFIQSGIETEEKTAVKAVVAKPTLKNDYEPAQKKPAVILSQRTEADKKIIMWSGIGFFMVIIFGIWIFQIKQTIIQTKIENNGGSKKDLSLIMGEVTDRIGQMKGDLDKIKNFNDANAASVVATSTINTATTSERLPINMEKLMDDIASSALRATSTMSATSSKEELKTEVIELKKKLEKENND